MWESEERWKVRSKSAPTLMPNPPSVNAAVLEVVPDVGYHAAIREALILNFVTDSSEERISSGHLPGLAASSHDMDVLRAGGIAGRSHCT